MEESNLLHGSTNRPQFIRPSQLVVYVHADEAKQRPPNPDLVKRIKKEFDERALGLPVISLRNGEFFILDGQNRIRAWAEMYGDKPIACRVYSGLTLEEEATLFLKLNNSKPVRTLDKFFVRVTSKDIDAMEIKRIVALHGFKVARGGGNGRIPAVDALAMAHRMRQLDPTLHAISNAWPNVPDATNTHIIKGVALLLAQPHIKFKEAIRAMEKYPGGPRGLLNDAMMIPGGRSDGNKYTRVFRQLLTKYNKGRTSHRLPEPWKVEEQLQFEA